MAQLRKPIEREPAAGLLGRVTRPVAQPVAAPPVAPPPAVAAPAVAAPAPAAQGVPDNWMNEFKRTGQVPDSLLKAWEAEGWMPVIQGGPNPWAAHAEYGLQLGKIPQPGYSSHASVNADGSIGETKTTKDSGSLLKAGLLKAAPIVLSLAAPGLGSAIGAGLGAGTGLAGSVVGGAVIGGGTAALSGGNILRGAAMGGLGGGASYGLGGVSEVPGGVDNYDLQGNFDLNPGYVPPNSVAAPGGLDSVSGYNPNGFGGLPKPIIGSELAGGASMIPGIDTNAFTGGLNTVAAGSGLTSLGGPPDMTPVGKPGLLEVPALPEVAPPQSLLEAPPPIVEPTIPKPVSNDPFKDVSGYNPDGFGGTPKPIIASEAPGLSQIPGMNPDAFAPGYGGLLPGNGVTSPGAPMDQNLYQQAVAKGKELLAAGKDNEFYQWMTDPANALYVKAAMAGGGALLSSVGSSSSGGSSYKDDGYRPTISRGGFQASIPATGAAPGGPGMAPGGFGSGISLPTTGQANDGLWRYAGNRPGGSLPSLSASSLISPPYTAPQTGLISPPAVANYNPRPTGPLPTNVPPMQYGYDDPVGNRQNLTPAQQRLLQNATGLLGTPAPRGFF